MITHHKGTKGDKKEGNMKNDEKNQQREQRLKELDDLLQQLGWSYADLAREMDKQDYENPDDDSIDKIKENVKKSLQKSRREGIKLSTVGKYIACIKRSDEYKKLGVEMPFLDNGDKGERELLQKVREISQKFWSEC